MTNCDCDAAIWIEGILAFIALVIAIISITKRKTVIIFFCIIIMILIFWNGCVQHRICLDTQKANDTLVIKNKEIDSINSNTIIISNKLNALQTLLAKTKDSLNNCKYNIKGNTYNKSPSINGPNAKQNITY